MSSSDRALEEDFEPALLPVLDAVEHGHEVAHDAVAVLDGERGDIFDRVAEHAARRGVHTLDRAEQPTQDVARMNGVLEQRAAARLGPFGSPTRVAGDDPAGGPELVVAQRVGHRRARLRCLDHRAQPPDERMEPRLEPDLHREPRVPHDAHDVAHDVEGGSERLLREARLAGVRDRGDVVAVEPGRRDVDDRIDLGVVDHREAIIAGVLDAAQDLDDACNSGGIRIGGRGHSHEPVVRQESQRRRVRLRDRAAADDAEPERIAHEVGEKLGAVSDWPCNASNGSRRSP